MDIYLIRHTDTANEAGLCFGQTDIPVAASFETDVDNIHGKLPEFSEQCRVISSPLSRCLQLAKTFDDEVSTDARLQELYFGDWENTRFDDIDAEALQIWMDNFATAAPPNGESFFDLYQRTGEFWQYLLENRSEQVIVVTHAGVIRALLARVLNMPLESAFQLRIDAGSVSKLRCVDDYVYIEYVNL